MTRRTLAAGAAIFFSLAVVPGAGAHTTIIEPAGSHLPYQQWIDESAVPTPDVTIEVIETEAANPCPGLPEDFAEACTDMKGHIWIAATDAVGFFPRADFMHEVGHNFDADNLPGWARERFDALYGFSGPWRNPAQPKEMTPSEWFAEAYSECAVKPYIKVSEWDHSYAVQMYGGQPIFFRRVPFNKTCRMIQSL